MIGLGLVFDTVLKFDEDGGVSRSHFFAADVHAINDALGPFNDLFKLFSHARDPKGFHFSFLFFAACLQLKFCHVVFATEFGKRPVFWITVGRAFLLLVDLELANFRNNWWEGNQGEFKVVLYKTYFVAKKAVVVFEEGFVFLV